MFIPFGPGAEIFDLKNKGGLESLWDYLSSARSAERFGVDRRHQRSFLDVEQKHIFGMFYTISTGSINRDALPDLKIRSFEELLSPHSKEKLVSVGSARRRLGRVAWRRRFSNGTAATG